MKKSRYPEHQIIKILKEVEGGRLLKRKWDRSIYEWGTGIRMKYSRPGRPPAGKVNDKINLSRFTAAQVDRPQVKLTIK